MLGVNRQLEELESEGKYISVGLIGAGQMGRGMISQIEGMKGMKTVVVADINVDNVLHGFHAAGIDEGSIREASSTEEVDRFVKDGKYVAVKDAKLVYENEKVDVVVDATGVPEIGADIAWNSIQNHKHIVMLNVEADVTVGAYLYEEAKKKGVTYTGSAGDEPGAIMELHDFADALGFDIVALGKGKNNPLNQYSNPDVTKEEAERKGASPKMLASFQDGTKTMVEMNAVANATGFTPDTPGMHGYSGSVQELPSIFRKEEDGGKIKKHKIVDYINGVAPGVFAIITSDKEEVREEMKYLSMGEGPHYVLYRPYHLTSLETPLSIARAYLDNKPTIAPYRGMVAETVAVAKKDLKAGDYLDGIGGHTVYGKVDEYESAKRDNALPIGLVSGNIKIKRDIAQDQILTYDDVELEGESFLWDLRKAQDNM
ncbi:NAD(P)H-dependent oxidoreductase [Salimicrobium halophilum]|uniref:Predicted homoserine dehydrogenase, contains C-terminal SAF domain n=1 Tax=Salimicrobium halophilum TaxID=86666 RepID=A0A1G8USX6_9BACI|nr:SAF domain-containing protein [Salimicrobium halophilum]SDJ56657.1 Predicted homoserine dehydrogenase, contains C-terminal SAF domain [Salimicrobium halophilum]